MIPISLVIPAYNEETTLTHVVQRSLVVLRNCSKDYELIILDDGSTDNTMKIMNSLQKEAPNVIRTMKHDRNLGIAATFEDLYRSATKKYIFLLPGDAQFPPEALYKCLPLTTHYDIIICNRTYKHYTPLRHCISAYYRWSSFFLFGIDLFDPGSIKLIKRKIVTDIHTSSKGVFIEAERIIRAVRQGYRIGRVNIRENCKDSKSGGMHISLLPQTIVEMIFLWLRIVILRQPP